MSRVMKPSKIAPDTPNPGNMKSTTSSAMTSASASTRVHEFLDMIERDPNDINAWVRMEFDEILAEPAGPRSVDL